MLFAPVRNKVWVVAAGLLILATGCTVEPIQEYYVAKLTVAREVRMTVAIAESATANWFFKWTGEPELIAEHDSQWQSFLKSIRIDDQGKPQWSLPDGWKQIDGTDAMRVATLVIGDHDPQLEVAVTQLPPGQDLLFNVNRWRGQLGLANINADQMDAALSDYSDGAMPLKIFSETGVLAGSATPGMFAGMTTPPAAGNESAATGGGMSVDPPEGWETDSAGTFGIAKYIKKSGAQSASISVTRLSAPAQNWPEFVKLWTGELELPELSAADVDSQTQSLTIDGTEAKRIDLKSADGARSISVVHMIQGTDAWFFKLSGDASVVDAELPVWEKFIASIRIPRPEPTE